MGVQWTARVEEQLKAQCPACRVKVHNQGMDWYTTLHSLMNYQTNVRRDKPSIIVLMHGINDLMHNVDFGQLSSGLYRADYGHYLGPVTRFVKRKGPLATLYQHFRMHWYAPEKRTVEADHYPGLDAFAWNIQTIALLAAADNTRVVIMTEPYLYRRDLSDQEKAAMVMFNFEANGPTARWTWDSALRGMQAYNEKAREISRTAGLSLIDMEPLVPKSLDHFTDDVHFTDKAHKLVAGVVAKRLLPIVQERVQSSSAASVQGGIL